MKLLVMTHNYIGPTFHESLPNKVIQCDDNVVVPISGDWLLKNKQPPVDEPQGQRRWVINELYGDPLTVLTAQQPDLVMVYFGMGDDGDTSLISKFAEYAIRRHTSVKQLHVVWPSDITRRRELYAMLVSNWRHNAPMPAIHFAEPTGNLTMARLVNEFLETGAIRDPADC